jgi:hypothetical protein
VLGDSSTDRMKWQSLPSPVFIHNHLPVKMEPTVSSETSAFKIQTPGKYPEEYLPHLQHGESLKTMVSLHVTLRNCMS